MAYDHVMPASMPPPDASKNIVFFKIPTLFKKKVRARYQRAYY